MLITQTFLKLVTRTIAALFLLISWFTPFILLFNNLSLTYNPLEYSTNWKSWEGWNVQGRAGTNGRRLTKVDKSVFRKPIVVSSE